jgi:hypothetical protein
MEFDVLRELQERGRFFWEMFPGARASDAWQRQREQIERNEKTAGGESSPAENDPGERKPRSRWRNEGRSVEYSSRPNGAQ